MGRFSTTVHIRNNVDRIRFVNTFCDIMKKRGYVPCYEEEGKVSYLFVFGEDWVTLAAGGYKSNPQKAAYDVWEMAAALKTSAFSVEVVDSDFAFLTLFNAAGKQDRVVVGDGSGYDIPEMVGDRKMWERLLANGKSWELFSEAAASQEVFVEDALIKVADVLGIDPNYIDADHDEVSKKADGNSNIAALHFKNLGDKSLTLSEAFVKVFGEALEPLGFKRVKNKYPYFVRVAGEEIIHVITYRKMNESTSPSGYDGMTYGDFDIICKAETVYCRDFELPTDHIERDSRFISNSLIYFKEHIYDYEQAYSSGIFSFPYTAGDEKQIISSFGRALEATKQNILIALEKITDLKSYLEFTLKFNEPFLEYKPGSYDRLDQYDGLVRLKVDTWESFVERNERYRMSAFDAENERDKRNYLAKYPEKLAYYLENTDKERKRYIAEHEQRETFAKQMFGDKEWCEKAFEELERRKKANTETLRRYGLDI